MEDLDSLLEEIDRLSEEAVKGRLKEEAREKLKEIYYNSDFREARISAGRALNYAPLRIFAREYPITTLIASTLLAGTAINIAYSLLSYSLRN